jgi:hypothetical protein
MKFNSTRDRQCIRRKERENCREYKKKRIIRKKNRSANSKKAEMLEGPTYKVVFSLVQR